MEEDSPCCLHLLGLAWFKQFVYLLSIQNKTIYLFQLAQFIMN